MQKISQERSSSTLRSNDLNIVFLDVGNRPRLDLGCFYQLGLRTQLSIGYD
jgi:hypothetical protein